MMGMVTQIKIKLLKARLKREYTRYQSLKFRYDCGEALTKHINPEFEGVIQSLNGTLDELAKLDPTAPKIRF
jgi:hypothetical protein